MLHMHLMKFQSYLTGIEITGGGIRAIRRTRFQSYLTGIEILQDGLLETLAPVPIVPYWN